jgi:hypothetical protein
MWIAICSVVGLLVAFALTAWWAKGQSAATQAALDKLAAVGTAAAIKEKTDEIAAAATRARVNTGRYDDERLSTTPLPPDAYRD